MIDMPTIESIRDMSRQGHTNAEIQRRTGVSQPTIRKYLAMDDFSPQMPVESRRGSILDPYKPFGDSIPEGDGASGASSATAPRGSTGGCSTRRPMRADTGP